MKHPNMPDNVPDDWVPDTRKFVVAGPQDFDDWLGMCKNIGRVHQFWTLVHGNRPGADQMAHKFWADEHFHVAEPTVPEETLTEDVALLIAFPGGEGTEKAISTALKLGIHVFFVGDMDRTAAQK